MNDKLKHASVANNRKQKRVIRTDIVVLLEQNNSKKTCPVFVELINISPESMLFRCKKSLRVSESLNMKLSFSDNRSFCWKAE